MSDYCTTLIVPGLHGSGPNHWQTWWQARDRNACRIELDDWERPDLARWSDSLRAELRLSRGDVWIVAHSFGCLAALNVAQEDGFRIGGLFLVGAADPDKFGVAAQLPERLDIPSVLVGSRTDPWLDFGKTRRWAARLGSRFVDLGDAGHINTESGFGPWQAGFDLFADFRREVEIARLSEALI